MRGRNDEQKRLRCQAGPPIALPDGCETSAAPTIWRLSLRNAEFHATAFPTNRIPCTHRKNVVDGEQQLMDLTWITDRVAVGGGIETDENMRCVVAAGITHILDMQIEFDDRPLARPYKLKVLWNGTYNDFQPKPPELFERGVEFALAALRKRNAKLLIHCTLGMHRAPTMALAVLCAMGWPLEVAMQVIQKCRPVVYFADAYVESVQAFLAQRQESLSSSSGSYPQLQDPALAPTVLNP